VALTGYRREERSPPAANGVVSRACCPNAFNCEKVRPRRTARAEDRKKPQKMRSSFTVRSARGAARPTKRGFGQHAIEMPRCFHKIDTLFANCAMLCHAVALPAGSQAH
jgi:hypothetical protein